MRRPTRATFSQILHIVGEKARDANRVEVPFEFIAPPRDAYWTSDSRSGVDVPLGRAGATKLQSLALGKGTQPARRSSPARPARASRPCCTP